MCVCARARVCSSEVNYIIFSLMIGQNAHILYCIDDHCAAYVNGTIAALLFHHRITISLANIFSIEHQSWYQEMSRLKAKLESLQRSQRYKYYFTPDFFYPHKHDRLYGHCYTYSKTKVSENKNRNKWLYSPFPNYA